MLAMFIQKLCSIVDRMLKTTLWNTISHDNVKLSFLGIIIQVIQQLLALKGSKPTNNKIALNKSRPLCSIHIS